jgi:hypothetical protein
MLDEPAINDEYDLCDISQDYSLTPGFSLGVLRHITLIRALARNK